MSGCGWVEGVVGGRVEEQGGGSGGVEEVGPRV